MTKKLFIPVFALAFLMAGMAAAIPVSAQSATSSPFPAGCSSALGYSVTTGSPCNGTSFATTAPMTGCSTALGYSVINGRPCSGSSIALTYLAGCSSLVGYSVASGAPCNGTSVATIAQTGGTPGLPVTGSGGYAFPYLAIAVLSGIAAISGVYYLKRRSRVRA